MSPSVDVLTRVIQACGLDLLVRLVPREAGEWTRVEDSAQGAQSTLEERLEKLVGFVDVIEDGAEVKATTRQTKTAKNS